MDKFDCWMILKFNSPLSAKEEQYCKKSMSFWEIYKANDGKFHSHRENEKGSLFMFTAGIELDIPSIIPKIKELKIHYGDCEDDLVTEWKEEIAIGNIAIPHSANLNK